MAKNVHERAKPTDAISTNITGTSFDARRIRNLGVRQRIYSRSMSDKLEIRPVF